MCVCVCVLMPVLSLWHREVNNKVVNVTSRFLPQNKKIKYLFHLHIILSSFVVSVDVHSLVVQWSYILINLHVYLKFIFILPILSRIWGLLNWIDSDFTPLTSATSISSSQLIFLAWSGSFSLCSFFVLLYGEQINRQTGLLPGLI